MKQQSVDRSRIAHKQRSIDKSRISMRDIQKRKDINSIVTLSIHYVVF